MPMSAGRKAGVRNKTTQRRIDAAERAIMPAASSFQGAAGARCTAGLGAAIMQSRGPKWATVAEGLA
jgi:hypothetical protein